MMTLSDFESRVPVKILVRGEEYYITNAIKNIEETSIGAWKATVIGSEEYLVNLSLDGEKITSWYCNCPYDGTLCKHVVATLLTIRSYKKKRLTSQTEEATVVGDEMVVKKKAKDCVGNEEIAKLISFVDSQALAAFVCEYATAHADFSDALQQKFVPAKNKTNPVTDYSESIRACFTPTYRRPSSYHRYSNYEESDIDVYSASSQMNVYLNKATFLLEQKSFGDVASIALQIFRSIGDFCDEEEEYIVYDEAYLFPSIVLTLLTPFLLLYFLHHKSTYFYTSKIVSFIC